MQYDMRKLINELDFAELQDRAREFEEFNFERADKSNKLEIKISGHHCDNGIWEDNYLCCVDGTNRNGGYSGFGFPYQRKEFLSMTYSDVTQKFKRQFGIEDRAEAQLSLFSFLEQPMPQRKKAVNEM